MPILRTLLLYQTGLINMTGKRLRIVLTLYRTMQTKMLRGIRKKFIIVLLDSSGMYCDRIFMIEGQNNPTQHSKRQKPTRFKHPPCEMLPPFSTTGSTRNCSSHQNFRHSTAQLSPNLEIHLQRMGDKTWNTWWLINKVEKKFLESKKNIDLKTRILTSGLRWDLHWQRQEGRGKLQI